MYYITENYNGSKLSILVEKAAEFLFPSNTYCLCCGKIVDNTALYSLCDYCRERIQWGNIVIDTSAIRQEIGREEIEIDSIRAAAHYGLFTRPIVEQFKNEGKTYIARHMAEIMWERLVTDADARSAANAEIVVPAPTGRGEKERGFNHSKKLAHYIGMNMGVPVLDCLHKDKDAGTQKTAGSVERFTGIKGAISIKDWVDVQETDPGAMLRYHNDDHNADCRAKSEYDMAFDGMNRGALSIENAATADRRKTSKNIQKFDKRIFGKKVLLIDDVCTTGATLNECAAALKLAGATEVHGLVFATGNHYSYGYF